MRVKRKKKLKLYFEIVYRSSDSSFFRVLLTSRIDVSSSREDRGGGGKQKMADGVDHIDIYADVEEEFNQVGLL